MLRPMMVLALLAITALAGCADNGSPATVDDESNAADEGVKATKTTGVIRGVVVDPTVTPIEGAKVAIKSLKLETATLVDGSFAFAELEPGTYFLEVTKIGFKSVQAQAPVVAGVDKPAVVKIQIEVDAGAVPNYYTNKWEGHLRCGVMVPVITFPCSVIRGTEDTVGDYNSEVITFESLPTFIQSELQWTNTQPAGESLFFNYAHCCNNAGFAKNGTAQGPSPLIVNAHEAEMAGASILEDGLEVRVFGGPYPGTDNIGGLGLWGVGVQVEQPVASYTSYFYNFLPPMGWTFGTDGDPVVPS